MTDKWNRRGGPWPLRQNDLGWYVQKYYDARQQEWEPGWSPEQVAGIVGCKIRLVLQMVNWLDDNAFFERVKLGERL